MTDYSSGRVTVLEPPIDENEIYDNITGINDDELTPIAARHRFREFIRNFRRLNIFIYRETLLRNWNRQEYCIEVDISHINEYDVLLLNCLQTRPQDYLTYFELGIKDALKLFLHTRSEDKYTYSNQSFQIILKSAQLPNTLRNLTAEHVNKLVKIPGIIISCTKIKSKATLVYGKCSECVASCEFTQKYPFSGINIPNKCTITEKCTGIYTIIPHRSEYIDQQRLKLQESPEAVPTGEIPRTIHLTVDRYLVDRVAPGTRVSVVGISSLVTNSRVSSSGSSSQIPYIRVVGIQIDKDNGGRSGAVLTSQEEEEMQRLSRDPDIYNKISSSIAPQISGDYTVDIKKSIACLLMGGSRKVLADGGRLRGDIHILLMGDPSTAKSQFLKYVERVAPIGIYTSGKGSSAAGLTATVIKDSKGEFYLEGGAMVLADGGVICIDEFDKMREADRVAIHEAMEQQTISIAKAGITTVLNSRASVLAAANPIFGRYDDLKGVGENIDLMTTILSRFDCIFIVRDVRDIGRDRSIARHVLGIHINAAANAADPALNVDIDASTLKKYISYCRDRCAPRLSDEAAALLSGQYVHIRNRVRDSLKETPGESQVVPITIRQLEALVRLSESLAKMRLSAEATVADVEEALRLFKVSTLAASQANPALLGTIGATEDIKKAEEFLRRRIGLRMTVNAKKIVEEAVAQGYTDDSVKRGISAMILKNELQELNFRKMLRRLR